MKKTDIHKARSRTFNKLHLRYQKKTKLTNSVDFIRELPGTEGSRVGGDALVEQVDDVAVPASLRRRHSEGATNICNHFYSGREITGPASIPKPPSSSNVQCS